MSIIMLLPRIVSILIHFFLGSFDWAHAKAYIQSEIAARDINDGHPEGQRRHHHRS